MFETTETLQRPDTIDYRFPLTVLSEDEMLLQQIRGQVCAQEIAPLAHAMDRVQKMDPALIRKLFDQGLMGIEVPVEYGGSGASFFSSILAIQEISSVDPAVGTMVDVQNTLTVNALLSYGSSAQKDKYLPRIVTDLICS